jgi:hypothetical protein
VINETKSEMNALREVIAGLEKDGQKIITAAAQAGIQLGK